MAGHWQSLHEVTDFKEGKKKKKRKRKKNHSNGCKKTSDWCF